MKLVYDNDEHGNEILKDEDGIHHVMMGWEKPYMEKSIEVLDPIGSVLEIGFGLGYSATKICSYQKVTKYSVIECSPIVWKKFEEFKTLMKTSRPELDVDIIKGRWQDVLDTTGKFDTIYFDDYMHDNNQEAYTRHTKFLYEVLLNHTNIGSKLSSYTTSDKLLNDTIKCITHTIEEYPIEIPKYCNYAKGSKMYIPLMKKTRECDVDLKEKLFGDNSENNKRFQAQLEKYKTFIEKPKQIYCNIMVVDNFYTNPMDTRNFILTQDFGVKGNYPGNRTVSYATDELRNIIQKYVQPFAGKITAFPTIKENAYNGAFQYTTSRDRTWIHNDGWNNWAGVLYLTPNAPVTSGTGFYKLKDGTRTKQEMEARGNKEIIDNYSQDYTKWELIDRVGNVFNRLVLFNSNQFHASMDYFGTNKENGRLIQVFFFSTEA